MTLRPYARQEFLSDVIVIFAESGTYSWFKVRNYQWFQPDMEGGSAPASETAEGIPGPNALGKLRAENPDAEGTLPLIPLDLDLIEKGLARLIEGPVEGLAEEYRIRILGANAANNCGDIDVNDADIIVQAAVYNEIIFS